MGTEVYISELFDQLGSRPQDKGRTLRLGIMGGTFDPIHLGHLSCAERARDACGLDAVLFIPAGMSAFKLDQQVTDAQTRLAMCRAAVRSNPAFDISEIEIARPGISYTVDTLRQLREHYPDNVQLALIVGDDAARALPQWKEASEIARLANIIVVGRPGQLLEDDAELQALRDQGFRIERVETSGLDISSSALRQWASQGASIRYLVPELVADYIEVYHLYAPAQADDEQLSYAAAEEDEAEESVVERAADDPFSKENCKRMRGLLKQRVKPKRYQHSLNVAKVARKLAKMYDYDPDVARMAGILHDWDKALTNEELRDRAIELKLDVDPLVITDMPWLLHGPTAAAALAREYPEFGSEVFQAIARHTSGAPDMSELDCIIYIADIIEPDRTFGDQRGIQRLRSLVGTMPLEQLYFEAFKYTLEFLISTDRVLYPGTIETWNVLMRKYGHIARSNIDIWTV